MDGKDFVQERMKRLAQDLLRADKLAEIAQEDHAVDLKRRVCEDMERELWLRMGSSPRSSSSG
ncbi:hypothetical protein ACVA51_10920 [Pseudomonas luteola]